MRVDHRRDAVGLFRLCRQRIPSGGKGVRTVCPRPWPHRRQRAGHTLRDVARIAGSVSEVAKPLRCQPCPRRRRPVRECGIGQEVTARPLVANLDFHGLHHCSVSLFTESRLHPLNRDCVGVDLPVVLLHGRLHLIECRGVDSSHLCFQAGQVGSGGVQLRTLLGNRSAQSTDRRGVACDGEFLRNVIELHPVNQHDRVPRSLANHPQLRHDFGPVIADGVLEHKPRPRCGQIR
ncbi:hypothetical protein D3C72_1234280 [compost metagenome]